MTDAGDASVPGQRRDAGHIDDAGRAIDAGGVLAGDAGDRGSPSIGERCFPEIFDPAAPSPNYDPFAPVIGDHCVGTHHQTIRNVERVVFLGDSMTVGSPPTLSAQFYRSQLATRLADHFGIEPPSAVWQGYDPFEGTSVLRESGAFASCARWGARTEDLLETGTQLVDCFPSEAVRAKKTLVVMTVGGNDVARFTKAGAQAPYDESRQAVEAFVARLEQAVAWIKSPGRFPNGVDLVFANLYEFTDGTGALDSCPAVGLGSYVGFDTGFEPWEHPEWLQALMVWANEQFMRIAVETGSDLVFLLETFCGHGFAFDDVDNRCYRGPDAERWFDLTCIHPNPTGHAQIADFFFQVIRG